MPLATHADIVSAILALAKLNGGKVNLVKATDAKNKLTLEGKTLPDGTTTPDGVKTLPWIQAYAAAKEDAVRAIQMEAAANVEHTLDSPLTALFVRNSAHTPMYRWNLKLKEKIEQATPGDNPLVQQQMLTRLMTVLCQTEHQHLWDTTLAKGITIKQFLKSGAVGQLATINALWDECTEPGVYNTVQSAMVDNMNPVNASNEQLPSSIHPAGGGGGAVTTFKTGRVGTPFKDLGVGFRVEGSAAGKGIGWHLGRVMRDGMWPQVTIETLMQMMGKNVAGTKVAGATTAPRLNVEQKDLWNESGICVARSFFGATAFPYRYTTDNVILWALDVTGLTGFDTEEYQKGNKLSLNGPWRPGEKCFARIEPERVLGSVVIQKHGDKKGGWSFEVGPDAQWDLRAPGKAGQRDYIQAELAAWRGVRADVPTAYDFVNRQR
jgi:hypothetical protein